MIRRGLAAALACAALHAGPPYLTDDPEPVDLHHWEVYLFTAGQWLDGARAGAGPALEANYGPFADTQLQVQLPVAFAGDPDGGRHRGPGDAQVGFKVRLLHETDRLPQVAVYPQVQAPTGRADEGLGAGHWRVFLPVWVQKRLGAWSTCAGGGWWRNPGAGQRDYAQWGWLVQRELGEATSAGAEIFHQDPAAAGAPALTAWNVGLERAVAPGFALVASGGRVFRGGRGGQFYLGLKGTF